MTRDVALWNVYYIQVHNVIKCWNRIAEFPGLTTSSAITAVVENGVRVEKSVVCRRRSRSVFAVLEFDRAPAKKSCVMQVTLIGFVRGKNEDECISGFFCSRSKNRNKTSCPKLDDARSYASCFEIKNYRYQK
jgi:hypothetical protein